MKNEISSLLNSSLLLNNEKEKLKKTKKQIFNCNKQNNK